MIAAVTNYYNPSKKPEKIRAFQSFQNSIQGIPLYIVEAAFGDDPFQLPPNDHTIQVRCKDLIWQQYTLINLGIHRLPDKYDKAVWIDNDIMFSEPEWHERLDQLLNQFKVVQSYSTVTMLPKGSIPGNAGEIRKSVAKQALENASKPWNKKFSSNLDLSKKFPSGFSWGVQRDVVEKYRIYDYWITGSCDSAFVIAIWGDFNNPFMNRLNNTMKQHYMEWALPFQNYINHSVYCLNTHINHLWHGYRNYRRRWYCLKDLDPYNDIKIGENGCLEWCSNKPCLHEKCENMCKNYELEFTEHL